MAAALSPEVHLMRRRVRHVHIPDLPPVYAPRRLPTNIRDHIQGQITRQRALAEDLSIDGVAHGFAKAPSSFVSWVKRAGPPPTVLSFTRRPTYILPKHLVQAQEPWQAEYLTKALKSRMNLHFPEPPGWSSLPWRPFWEQKVKESEWKHDPLNHEWPDVGVLIMPCAEAMFLGPGQVSIWPIIDLRDEIQRGQAKLKTKYEYERILEDTTIEILRREFHIPAFAIPGSTGIWVESRIPPPEVDVDRVDGAETPSRPESMDVAKRRDNIRRIATIHTSITDDITQWGVSIHVGQPNPTVESWTSFTNPWTPIRQHTTTTSIAAELAYMKSTASPLGPNKYMLTHFDQNAVPARAGQGALPYSLIKVGSGRKSPAPLGMDNRDISTAWTYEFARQLGMKDGHVDHYSMVDTDDTDATQVPTKSSGAGFRFKGVFSEDVMNKAYQQVDVPPLLVGQHETVSPGIMEDSMRIEHHDGKIDSTTHDGWLLSWPLWESTLIQKLDEAICGGPCDTRLKAYGLQKQVSSQLQRRRNELKRAKEVGEEWRADMPHLIRRPLHDDVIRELADRSREMERILKTVRIGTKSAKLLNSTIQIRRLLERRFAGAFDRNAGNPVLKEAELSSVSRVASKAASTASAVTSTTKGATKLSPKLARTTNPAQASETRPPNSTQNQTKTTRKQPHELEAQSGPMSFRQKRPGGLVGFAETKAQERRKVLQEHGKGSVRIKRLSLVESTDPKLEVNWEKVKEDVRAHQEHLEAAKKLGKDLVRKFRWKGPHAKDASQGTAAVGISQFLPNTQQIGGP